jgi:hypothetical protein
LNVKIEGNNCRILKLPCWTSTSISYSSSFFGIYEIITIKDQSFFFWSFLIVKFFIPKFMKTKCCLRIFTFFGRDFYIKLTIHDSSLSLRCVSMSELEFFVVKGGLCPKLKHYGTCKFFEKNQRLQHQIHAITSCGTMDNFFH